MKKIVLSAMFLFLAISAISFAADEEYGGGGWAEYVSVQVLDSLGIPIEGAQVNITWEITDARGYATTKTLITDSVGKTGSFMLTNQEYNAEDTNYDYIVNARYNDAYANKTFTYGKGSAPRTVFLPLSTITFRIRDGAGLPVQVELVVDKKYSMHTNANGIATMLLANGTHSVQPYYMDMQDTTDFIVKGLQTVDLTMNLYALAVRVIDDEGNPIAAQVYAGTQTQKSIDDGWAYFKNITNPQVVVKTSYGRYAKTVPVDLDADDEAIVVFDTHPPEIESIQPQWQEKNLQVRAIIEDKGAYASGLRGGNASVELYYMGSDRVQKKVPMYSVGYKLYEGLIETDGQVQTIRYTVQASDADGNTASNSETFVIPTANPSGFVGGATPPANPVSEQNSADWAIIPVIVFVIAIVAVIGYYYYKMRMAAQMDAEEAMQAEEKKKEYSYSEKPSMSELVPKKQDSDMQIKPPSPPKSPKLEEK
ncbi:hypothetical protein COU37_04180 [Candidatus Micrarchaeota archaeon CG10_big_fil_rev_8_21_14_0_10_45_29]|nr:MAG: hypothetical protein COU37_04180 [Candidatus Micrarchaeota archaeon CG10_big_fil_rev_8_21_14_0_10_45_29]